MAGAAIHGQDDELRAASRQLGRRSQSLDEHARLVECLPDRPVTELSGGQRQRVWVAMVLAQDTDLLLLDEPTTFLDISHQIDLLDLLVDLEREAGKTIVVVLHDFGLACRYADHLIAMKDGAIVAAGPPAEIVDAGLVADVFGLACEVVPDPVTGSPLILPRGRHHTRVAAPG